MKAFAKSGAPDATTHPSLTRTYLFLQYSNQTDYNARCSCLRSPNQSGCKYQPPFSRRTESKRNHQRFVFLARMALIMLSNSGRGDRGGYLIGIDALHVTRRHGSHDVIVSLASRNSWNRHTELRQRLTEFSSVYGPPDTVPR